jgi:NAD(P)-dependent dehydrogenase (short-subunit alcohol dehydrogenase family)
MLAAAGARVALTDTDDRALDAAASELASQGLQVETHILDVTDEAAVGRVFAALLKSTGRFDILINNAGIGARTASVDLERSRWDRVLAVNVTGAFLCARAAARILIPAGRGAIVNIASIMGVVGNRIYPNPAYHASKGALVNLTRALAMEWSAHGLRVNAVAPGYVATPLTESLLADREVAQAVAAGTPLGRLADPIDIASAVLYLASDASAMVTGHILAVDGGWLAQ